MAAGLYYLVVLGCGVFDDKTSRDPPGVWNNCPFMKSMGEAGDKGTIDIHAVLHKAQK